MSTQIEGSTRLGQRGSKRSQEPHPHRPLSFFPSPPYTLWPSPENTAYQLGVLRAFPEGSLQVKETAARAKIPDHNSTLTINVTLAGYLFGLKC